MTSNSEQKYCSPAQQVKDLRREGVKLIQSVKDYPPSREVSLAITKFQEGVMWLEMELRRIT